MKKMKPRKEILKKLLSTFLTLVMVVGLIPATCFTTNVDAAVTRYYSGEVDYANLKKGDKIKAGVTIKNSGDLIIDLEIYSYDYAVYRRLKTDAGYLDEDQGIHIETNSGRETHIFEDVTISASYAAEDSSVTITSDSQWWEIGYIEEYGNIIIFPAARPGESYPKTGPFTVTYNTNGGSLPEGYTNSVSVDTYLPSDLPRPTKENFTFGGWYMDEEYNEEAKAGDEIESDITLYARWVNVYNITYNLNGGTWKEGYSVPTTNVEGETLTLPTLTEILKDGMLFVGWYDNSEFSGDALTELDGNGDKELYAKWDDYPNTIYLSGGTVKLGSKTWGDDEVASYGGITATSLGDGSYSYTFTNVNFTTDANIAVEVLDDDATVNLSGDNVVNAGDSSTENCYGLYAHKNLKIDSSNEGTLTAVGGDSSSSDSIGICTKGDLSIENGNVIANNGVAGEYGYGVLVSGVLTVKENAKLQAEITNQSQSDMCGLRVEGENYALINYGEIVASTEKKIPVDGYTFGINLTNGGIENYGTITATSGDNNSWNSMGIDIPEILETRSSVIKNYGTIIATSGDVSGSRLTAAIFCIGIENEENALIVGNSGVGEATYAVEACSNITNKGIIRGICKEGDDIELSTAVYSSEGIENISGAIVAIPSEAAFTQAVMTYGSIKVDSGAIFAHGSAYSSKETLTDTENYTLWAEKTEMTERVVEYGDYGNHIVVPDGYKYMVFRHSGPSNTVSLTTKDSVDVNFYIDTDFYLLSPYTGEYDPDAYIELSYNHNDITYDTQVSSDRIKVSTVRQSDGRAKVTVKSAPAQITENIDVTLYDSEGNVQYEKKDYSMYKYCKAVIGNENSDAEAVAVCKALIDYAITAQNLFEYNTSNMANEGTYFDSSLSSVTADDILNAVSKGLDANPTATCQGSFPVSGIALMSWSNTAVRFYYTNAIDPEDYTLDVTMDNKYGSGKLSATFKTTAEGTFIEVSGIESANLDNVFTLTITDKSGSDVTTIKYNALAYCYTVLKNSSSSYQQELARALFKYNQAAQAYFVD